MRENLKTVLEGRVVRLEPLGWCHEEGLFEAARDPGIWRWLPQDPSRDRTVFRGWIEDAIASSEAGREAAFATIDVCTGNPIGSTRYLDWRPEHKGLEIGWTWLAPFAWGTGANVEAKLLMLGHAFGPLDCMRVEFKADARNERSRGALAALPARFEGIFRKHRLLLEGQEIRDSAYYSIVDDEWPEVEANLRRRLEGDERREEVN